MLPSGYCASLFLTRALVPSHQNANLFHLTLFQIPSPDLFGVLQGEASQISPCGSTTTLSSPWEIQEEGLGPRIKNLGSWSKKTKKGNIKKSWKGGTANSTAYPFMSSHKVIAEALLSTSFYARHSSTHLNTFTHIIAIARYYFYPHFTDEQTEAQRRHITCSSWTDYQVARGGV